MKYLVYYDITETKRLYRISKAMESLGYRVQKSFFICDLSKTEYEMLCDVINNTIEPNDDKVAIYEIYVKSVYLMEYTLDAAWIAFSKVII